MQPAVEQAMRAHERGFSLVETIISIGLLTGAFVTLAQVVATSARVNAIATHRVRATLAAEQKLEELRSAPVLSDVLDKVEQLDAAGSPVCEGVEPCAGAVYVRHSNVAPLESAPDAVLLRVVVRNAHSGEVRLVTVRARKVR